MTVRSYSTFIFICCHTLLVITDQKDLLFEVQHWTCDNTIIVSVNLTYTRTYATSHFYFKEQISRNVGPHQRNSFSRKPSFQIWLRLKEECIDELVFAWNFFKARHAKPPPSRRKMKHINMTLIKLHTTCIVRTICTRSLACETHNQPHSHHYYHIQYDTFQYCLSKPRK